MPVYEYVCRKCSARYDLSRPMSRSEEDTPCPHCDGTGQRVYSVFTALSKGIGTISTRHSVGRAGAAATVVQEAPEARAADAPLEVEALVLRSFDTVRSAAPPSSARHGLRPSPTSSEPPTTPTPPSASFRAAAAIAPSWEAQTFPPTSQSGAQGPSPCPATTKRPPTYERRCGRWRWS